jgi:hypothetical protein
MDGGLPERFPAQDYESVRDVVGKSHFDYDAVQELVTTRPELAKAAWDWGFGDWESALGAASHVGRPDIATILIEHGARPDLFTFAMMGQVDAVRAVCTANPGIQGVPGPHGITLLRHAKAGGDDAKAVVEYLEELGGADVRQTSEPLDKEAAETYVGEYVPEGAPDVTLHVKYNERRSSVTIGRDDESTRFLLYRGNHEFSPAGAASVVFAFELHEEQATAMTLQDGALALRSTRRR